MNNEITRQAYEHNSEQGLAAWEDFINNETNKPMELTTEILPIYIQLRNIRKKYLLLYMTTLHLISNV